MHTIHRFDRLLSSNIEKGQRVTIINRFIGIRGIGVKINNDPPGAQLYDPGPELVKCGSMVTDK